ncbi:MAG TPA: FHA domain-containing protein, partial [Desulfosalsimonadaceae bacterium]|nr:FHA domain-containing protein [Desulfosalsimonadaceae bacterium]
AREVIGKVLGRLAAEAQQFDGRVIKTVGDAIVCTFERTGSALEAARHMMQAMTCPVAGVVDAMEVPPVYIHVGVHYGSVLTDDGDIFGDAVNIAARVVNYANPRQIVATRAAMQNAGEEGGRAAKYLAAVSVKNISGKIELFEVVHEALDLTAVLEHRDVATPHPAALYLNWAGRVVVLDGSRPMVSVGREDYNDLVIKRPWISRSHARIENRSGTFVVSDTSTNGTFVYPAEDAPLCINKAEHPLAGNGAIVFGREREAAEETDTFHAIAYAVRHGRQ